MADGTPSPISHLPSPDPRAPSPISHLPSATAPPPGYIELPYTLPQDSTLFLLLRESSPAIWIKKLDWIAAHGGMALLDTHPDYMDFGEIGTSRSCPAHLYGDFLRYARAHFQESAWNTLPKDVARHMHSIMTPKVNTPSQQVAAVPMMSTPHKLAHKRAAVLLFSYYAKDPRPRRAAEALAEQGMTVDVICLRDDSSEPAFDSLNGVNIRRVPLRRRRGGKASYLFQYAAFISICFALLTVRSLRRRYHLVHVHNMPDVLVFSALVPKLLGAKVVLDLHDPMPELMMTIFNLDATSQAVAQLKRFERWSIALADTVFTVNQACKRMFGNRSCKPEKVRVIMNSPDERLFTLTTPEPARPRDPAKPFVIMYHGSLVERHGLDLAVEALGRVRKTIPTAELSVYGARTAFLDQVMDTVKARGLQDCVQYLGSKRIEDVAQAIRTCDLGIIPNRRSIFTEINTPTRIFEYLTCGKPVIAPCVPGIRDYFDDGQLIFFELGNAEDLARQIEFAYCHPQEVEEIILRGQQIYLEHRWSEERVRLVEHVSQILNGHAHPLKG